MHNLPWSCQPGCNLCHVKETPCVFCSHSSITVCEMNWKSKWILRRITAAHSKFLFILSWSQLDFPLHALYQCTCVEIQSTRLPSCCPSNTRLYSYLLLCGEWRSPRRLKNYRFCRVTLCLQRLQSVILSKITDCKCCKCCSVKCEIIITLN